MGDAERVIGASVSVRKTSMSPRSNWIQLDGSGHGSFLDVDKFDIMHRLHIDARDLRILDPLLSYPSTILSRDNAIVLNLEHIKAIITAREVFVQDPTDENVAPVVGELQRRLSMPANIHTYQGDGQHDTEAAEEDESPFEFRALEVVLEAVCSFLSARTTELEMATYPALDELTSKTSSRNLEKVRRLKSAMTRLTARVQKVRDELEQLMDGDDDMADLYLSRKLAGPSSSFIGFGASRTAGSKISTSKASVATFPGDEDDVEELEMLLEVYFMQIDDTLNKLTTLRGYIDDTEDYINIQIDNHRNQLIQLELFLKTGEISLSLYSLVAAIFGTNFPFSWNDNHGYLFKWVVIFSGVASAVMFLGTIGYARKKGVVGR